jgi:hypothetical protein
MSAVTAVVTSNCQSNLTDTLHQQTQQQAYNPMINQQQQEMQNLYQQSVSMGSWGASKIKLFQKLINTGEYISLGGICLCGLKLGCLTIILEFIRRRSVDLIKR